MGLVYTITMLLCSFMVFESLDAAKPSLGK